MRRAYQSKGGSVRTAKGFAKMDKDKHLQVSAQGGAQKIVLSKLPQDDGIKILEQILNNEEHDELQK